MMRDIELEIIVPKCADETRQLDHALVTLTEAISQIDADVVAHGLLGGPFGYGANYENDVFSMRSDYQDAECDCGANERADQWHRENAHARDCFREELHRRFAAYDEASGYNAADCARLAPGMMEHFTEELPCPEFDGTALPFRGHLFYSRRTSAGEVAFQAWVKARGLRMEKHDRIKETLYQERGIKPSPYVWHCDCGVDALQKEYVFTHSHSPTCALEIPNFRHKATGFEVRWYKSIGRDMEVKNGQASDLQAIFSECLASLISPRA